MTFWNVTAAEAHQQRFRHHLCQWYRPTEEEHGMASVPLAPVDSKRHRILWTTSLQNVDKKQNYECQQENMLKYKQSEGKKTVCAGEK